MTEAAGLPLRLERVGVRYPGRRTAALTDVDLVVEPGERVGVTGLTGAGASTLALLAAGLLPRVIRATVTGDVAIDGVGMSAATADPGALLGRVGIVFATPANQLSGSKPSVREELAFGLENLAVPRAAMDARIDAVMDRLGIAHLADREPLALSGGEQQRVAIASIVIMGPRLLVLDEPTAQLDPSGTAAVAALLAELAAGGTAVLCVERDPVVLAGMDRIVVLDGGRVAGVDRPGIALGRSIAGRVGVPAPTLVRLAEAAGVEQPDDMFDLDAIVTALRRGGVGRPPPADGEPHPPARPAMDPPLPARPVPIIEVDGLVHRYPGGIEAVRGVSLRIDPGASVAIVGQNGSGKTTLVKHLIGLLRPAAGDVRLDGRSIASERIDVLAATVGFAFQDPSQQLFERSLEREVAFGPRNLGLDADRVAARVDAALRAVGLGEERTTNPYDLDPGHRKLVALAAVLAMEPAIVILDEPTTGQDPLGIARLEAIVRGLHAAGRTVIAITHDMEFAATFERVVVMRDGGVAADGPPGAVLASGAASLLSTAGLTPPPAAEIAARLGLPAGVLSAAAVLAALAGTDDE